MELVGVSEYYYTTEDNFLMSGDFKTDKFHKTANNWCSTDKEVLYDNWKSGIYSANEHRMKLQCFKAAWLSVMLYEGLGFDIFDDSFKGGYGAVKTTAGAMD